MASASEFGNVPGLSKEVREELASTFDALANWRDEVETANDRCLKKVLDHTSRVARSLGWPDQAMNATREHLENTARMQTHMIDGIIEGWRNQLKTSSDPSAVPRGFTDLMSGSKAMGWTPMGGMPDLVAFTPWGLWLQAAEAWQRAWMPDTSRRGRAH